MSARTKRNLTLPFVLLGAGFAVASLVSIVTAGAPTAAGMGLGAVVMFFFAYMEKRTRQDQRRRAREAEEAIDAIEGTHAEHQVAGQQAPEQQAVAQQTAEQASAEEPVNLIRDAEEATRLARQTLARVATAVEGNPAALDLVRAGFKARVARELHGVFDRVLEESTGEAAPESSPWEAEEVATRMPQDVASQAAPPASPQRAPESAEIRRLKRQAEAALSSGDMEAAQQSYRALLLMQLGPSSSITKAEVYYGLAVAYDGTGETRKALQFLERATSDDSNFAPAQELLAKLRR